jgi:hypothetical protein
MDEISRRRHRALDRVIQGRVDLISLFEHEIQAGHVSESLQSCADEDSAEAALARMTERDFDVLGIRHDKPSTPDGRIYGFVHRARLDAGRCEKFAQVFHPFDLIAATTPLIDVLDSLRDRERVFVMQHRIVTGIITRADLQKPPIRLLLFGLVTVFETSMLRAIRSRYPNGSWRAQLTDGRVLAAENLLHQRQLRNEAIDLADCLQFCDKREILVKDVKVREALGFATKGSATATLKSVEALRDRLAHAQDLVAGSSWSELIDTVQELDELIACLTQVDGAASRAHSA